MVGAVTGSYRCIECGRSEPELFHSYCDGVVKVMHCDGCKQLVDKYIEFDFVVIFLDAILHKAQAYRHLLFNVNIPSPWKLALIYLLCDTYIEWQAIDTKQQHPVVDEYIFYAALEWDVYIIFVVVLIEWLLLTTITTAMMFTASLLNYLPPCQQLPGCSHSLIWLVHRAMVVSSFGKLLAIPAIIWAQTHSAIYLLFTELFVFTSNVAAVKVLPGVNLIQSIIILSTAHTVRKCIGRVLIHNLYSL
jgi:hypothetical protein